MAGGPIAKVAAYPVPSAAVGHAYTNEHYDQHHHHQKQQHLDYTPTSVHKTVEHAVPVKSTFYTSAAPSTPVHHYSAGEKHIHTVPSQTLAIVPAHHKQPAVYESHGHTHESVMRDHDGTVSHYGKTLSTPHSHVHKEDTRIVKDQYYASPVVAHPAPVHHYSVAAPVVHHQYKAVAPVAADVHHYSHEAPAAVHQYSNAGHQQHVHEYTQAAAAPVVHHHHQYEEPHHQYSHAAPHQYANSAPVVGHKSVSYSPAEAVAQVSFKSADAHYSW